MALSRTGPVRRWLLRGALALGVAATVAASATAVTLAASGVFDYRARRSACGCSMAVSAPRSSARWPSSATALRSSSAARPAGCTMRAWRPSASRCRRPSCA